MFVTASSYHDLSRVAGNALVHFLPLLSGRPLFVDDIAVVSAGEDSAFAATFRFLSILGAGSSGAVFTAAFFRAAFLGTGLSATAALAFQV